MSFSVVGGEVFSFSNFARWTRTWPGVGTIHRIEIQAVIVDSDAIQRIKVHGVTSNTEA
jgi:hypothetical protein